MILAGAGIVGSQETPEETAGFTVTVTEVSPNVVWSGSGTLNLAGLTAGGTTSTGSGYASQVAVWIAGASPSTLLDLYDGISTFPASFGAGGTAPATSATGSAFAILPDFENPGLRQLAVPNGYISGTFLSGSTTYESTGLTGMGLTPGTYTYTWGSGANADSITLIIG